MQKNSFREAESSVERMTRLIRTIGAEIGAGAPREHRQRHAARRLGLTESQAFRYWYGNNKIINPDHLERAMDLVPGERATGSDRILVQTLEKVYAAIQSFEATLEAAIHAAGDELPVGQGGRNHHSRDYRAPTSARGEVVPFQGAPRRELTSTS